LKTTQDPMTLILWCVTGSRSRRSTCFACDPQHKQTRPDLLVPYLMQCVCDCPGSMQPILTSRAPAMGRPSLSLASQGVGLSMACKPSLALAQPDYFVPVRLLLLLSVV
jgi:hypothetical protein